MEEQNAQESQSPMQSKGPDNGKLNKKIVFLGIGLIVAIAAIWLIFRYLIPKMAEVEWFSNRMIAVYIAVGVIVGGVAACLILRKTLRTRLRVEKAIREDPDINDWLIVFDWTPKILYVPTIVTSLLAAVVSWIFSSIPPGVIGGLWFVVFFLNFIVEEYNISIKVLLIILAALGFFFLWLHLFDCVVSFLHLFRHIALSMNATVYLLVGIIGLLTVLVSWLKGLFYYLTITPNYMNVQEGPTESGEQIGREDYNSRVDTSDFLERLMGFGRIIITFKDRNRQPITVLVWRIQRKAQLLENVRGKLAIDQIQPAQSSRQ
ncbi:MAG: hypothetical protein JXN61_05550 [Sedimentisphaerales bacterium]|nr:hypothetical protein [Sedimentisphaerales bacterium]